MESLQRWKSSRKAYRTHLTKLHRTVTEIMDSSEAPNESQLDSLSTSIEKLQHKAKAIGELDTKIAGELQDAEELERDVLEAIELQDGITERIYQIKRFISRRAKPVEPLPRSGISSQSSSLSAGAQPFVPLNVVTDTSNHEDDQEILNQNLFPNSGSHGSMASQLSHSVSRLPKLSLPSFSGDPLSWQTFWDSFSAAVDSSPVLSGVQKFNYLRTLLQGEAARAVAGFPLTDANYSHSVEILKERFGQTQKIVNAHMQSLLNLPSPRNTLTDLRAFYDSIESHIRGLSSLEITPDSYGALLIPITLGKLPADVRRNLAREQNKSDWNIEELREALLREIRILEQGVFTSTTDTLPMMTASLYTGIRSGHSRQYRPTDRGTLNRKLTCVYCKGTHTANHCDVVVSTEKRLEHVKKEGLCFNCLGKHRVSKCTSQTRCKKCNNKHHTSICGAGPLQPTQRDHTTPSTETKSHVQPPMQKDHTAKSTETNQAQNTVPVTTTIALANTQASVLCNSVCLLKTAVAKVVSDVGSATANILFDEGAQRSFISKELANTLKLTPCRSENISLVPFGADASTPQHLDVAVITIVSYTGEMIPLSVLVVPKIAAPLQTITRSQLHALPYLRGLTLAHPMIGDKQFNVSLLIGVDYYWKLVGDDVIRGNGPTAVQSKLGNLLSGPLVQSVASNTVTSMHIGIHSEQGNVDQTLERFWEVESSGTFPIMKISDRFMDTYLSSITRQENGSYVVRFPWKEDHAPLPSNYEVCKQRTRSLVRRLASTPDLMRTYDQIIKEQERRGFVERVSSTSQLGNGQAHYIPHHHVKKESSTTPIRVVYDCSCRMSNNHPSLNDCLEVGPPLVNDLCSILIRFRVHKFGLTTDIEKAFLHVQLHKDDCDFTRF